MRFLDSRTKKGRWLRDGDDIDFLCLIVIDIDSPSPKEKRKRKMKWIEVLKVAPVQHFISFPVLFLRIQQLMDVELDPEFLSGRLDRWLVSELLFFDHLSLTFHSFQSFHSFQVGLDGLRLGVPPANHQSRVPVFWLAVAEWNSSSMTTTSRQQDRGRGRNEMLGELTSSQFLPFPSLLPAVAGPPNRLWDKWLMAIGGRREKELELSWCWNCCPTTNQSHSPRKKEQIGTRNWRRLIAGQSILHSFLSYLVPSCCGHPFKSVLSTALEWWPSFKKRRQP